MKNILNAPFVEEMRKTAANMYRLGWDERNGGNISYLLDEKEVGEYLDLEQVIRVLPLGFDATALAGKIFIVTGSGKYFKNVDVNPENCLGIVRISADGQNAELLWGYNDGGKCTSEFPAHLMSHKNEPKQGAQPSGTVKLANQPGSGRNHRAAGKSQKNDEGKHTEHGFGEQQEP